MILFSLALWGAAVAASSQAPEGAPPQSAAAYVETFLDIIHREAWTGDRPEWPAIAETARREAATAEDALATYPILERVIRGIGDEHGGLMVSPEREAEFKRRYNTLWYTPPTSNPVSKYMDRTEASFRDLALPNGRLIRVLVLPRLFAEQDGQAYARTLFDAAGDPSPLICGFIVDLRGNIGGTMWPMLSAVSPLLGEGDIGAFTRRTGPPQPWRIVDGASGLMLDPEHHRAVFSMSGWRQPPLDRDRAPVAVLFDNGTLSSGEALATAFSGRPNTRAFGAKTFGLASNNRPFPLSDGTTLLLVTGLYQDRTGRKFPEGLTPDVAIAHLAPDVDGIPADTVAARNWLADQEPCRSAQ